MSQRAVLITTAHRGVFFGYVEEQPSPDRITLTNARMCVYWSQDMKGILGLASMGPSKNCRIGPAVSRIEINAVTAVVDVSEAARGKWETAPWQS